MKKKYQWIFIVSLNVIFLDCFGQIDEIKVMTFNRLYSTSSNSVTSAILAADADIVGLQEAYGVASTAANALGFYHYSSASWSIAILSRWPIINTGNYGVSIEVSPGQVIHVFTCHLQPYPYQPYDIRDGQLTTEAQAIAAAQNTRSTAVAQIISEMAPFIANGDPVFLTGDFNEPSFLDWTQAAADSGLHFGMKVEWPASGSFVNAGLHDSYRTIYPDPIIHKGNTWSSFNPPNEVHDRIDIVYFSGNNVNVNAIQIVAQNLNGADIAAANYASDHRSVVTTMSLLPDPVFVSATDTICKGSSYTLGTQTLDSAGTYTEVFHTTGGYDSTVTLTLYVNRMFNDTFSMQMCSGDHYAFGTQVISSEGTYQETFQSGPGCDSVVTINMAIVNLDTGVIQQGMQLISSDSTTSYQWLDCANNYAAISGAIDRTYSASSNGAYAVKLSKNGCTDTSACYQVINTGIFTKAFDSAITLSPNPTDDYFNLSIKGSCCDQIHFKIFNAVGLLVEESPEALHPGVNAMGIKLVQGIYTIEITKGEMRRTMRAVKLQ